MPRATWITATRHQPNVVPCYEHFLFFNIYFIYYLAVPGLSCVSNLGPPALGAWSLGHRTMREVPWMFSKSHQKNDVGDETHSHGRFGADPRPVCAPRFITRWSMDMTCGLGVRLCAGKGPAPGGDSPSISACQHPP